MRHTADAVIIGGGCMGASTAYHLAQRGLTNIVLVERESTLGAGSTGRNAGGVRHQFSHPSNVRLSIESINSIERFEDDVGYPVDLHQDGYLFLLSTPASVEVFRRNVTMQRTLGVEADVITPQEAARLAPGIQVHDVIAATFCARDGISDPNGVTMGFARRAQERGVEICRETEVLAIGTDQGHVTSVETSHGIIHTNIVINAAGPWAKSIGAMVGLDVPIEPHRRHIFLAQPSGSGDGDMPWPEGSVPSSRILVIDFETTFYFHREGAHVLFGMGDLNEPPTFDTTVQWEFLERVIPVATKRLPALGEAQIRRAWAGLYEMTPDAMPIIGPTAVSGFYLIAGFSGHGFQHSPAAGRVLADLIVGRDPGEIDLSPFAMNRFSGETVSRERTVV